MTRSDRWILSEYLVARDRVSKFHESLQYHRHKTPYAEVDLIVESPKGRELVLIEVKSIARELWAGEIISRYQRMRLEKARLYVESQTRRRTRLLLATVQMENSEPVIRYFDAPF